MFSNEGTINVVEETEIKDSPIAAATEDFHCVYLILVTSLLCDNILFFSGIFSPTFLTQAIHILAV